MSRDNVTSLHDGARPEFIEATHTDDGGRQSQRPFSLLESTDYHERVEKALLDAGHSYPEAHRAATESEHARMRQLGFDPNQVESLQQPYIDAAAHRARVMGDTTNEVSGEPYQDSGENAMRADGGEPDPRFVLDREGNKYTEPLHGKLLDQVEAVSARRPDGNYAVLDPHSGRVLAQGASREAANQAAGEFARGLGRRRLRVQLEREPALSQQQLRERFKERYPEARIGGSLNRPLFSRATREEGYAREAGDPIATFREINALKGHPDYAAAKTGDAAAAWRLVNDLVKPEQIKEAQRRFGRGAVFVPALAAEATGHNAIPDALARLYANATAGYVTHDIVQANQVHHTGAGPMERLAARPLFDGAVIPGAGHVLVDDVSTMGATLAELADHVRAGGGKVLGSVLLANASRSGKLTPSDPHVHLVEKRFGDEIRSHFSVEPTARTSDEAQYLSGFKNADQLRARIDKAQGEAARRLLSKRIGEAPERQITEEDKAPPSAGLSDSGEPLHSRGDAPLQPPSRRDVGSVDELSRVLSRIYGRTIRAVRVPPPNAAASALAGAVQRLFGRKVVFVRGDDPGMRGAYLGGKTLFINADADRPHAQIIGHELLHSLRCEAPGAYHQLVLDLHKALSQERGQGFKEYLGTLYQRQGLPQLNFDSLHEELMAEVVGDHFADPAFIRQLQKTLEPSLFRRIVAHLGDFIDQMRGRLSGSRPEMGRQAGRFVDDLDAARAAVGDALRRIGSGWDVADVDAQSPAFSRVRPEQKPRNPVIGGEGRYGDLVRTLGKGFQAHHLNQDAAFGEVIPKSEGFAIGIRGNAFTDVDSPHYNFHGVLEEIFDSYRRGGELFGERPTNAQYGDAVTQALHKAGIGKAEAKRLSHLAAKNRAEFGLLPEHPIPRIPRKIYRAGGK